MPKDSLIRRSRRKFSESYNEQESFFASLAQVMGYAVNAGQRSNKRLLIGAVFALMGKLDEVTIEHTYKQPSLSIRCLIKACNIPEISHTSPFSAKFSAILNMLKAKMVEFKNLDRKLPSLQMIEDVLSKRTPISSLEIPTTLDSYSKPLFKAIATFLGYTTIKRFNTKAKKMMIGGCLYMIDALDSRQLRRMQSEYSTVQNLLNNMYTAMGIWQLKESDAESAKKNILVTIEKKILEGKKAGRQVPPLQRLSQMLFELVITPRHNQPVTIQAHRTK